MLCSDPENRIHNPQLNIEPLHTPTEQPIQKDNVCVGGCEGHAACGGPVGLWVVDYAGGTVDLQGSFLFYFIFYFF